MPIRMMRAIFMLFFMFRWLTTQAGSRAKVKSLTTAKALYRYSSQTTMWMLMHEPSWFLSQ
jgi:hypothetical protein